LKTWLTSFAPDLWLLVLGALFIVVTLFLPRGLIGLIKGRGA
jgi:urea transport system permease protein